MFRGEIFAAVGLLFLSAHTMASEQALNVSNREQLTIYAKATWKSMEAMSRSGVLPVDHLVMTGEGWSAAKYTSPTNIAAYLWSTIGAENLGLIGPEEANRRIAVVLSALEGMERAEGFYYNWYDPESGKRLEIWPHGGKIRPFLSSVDNGWLAAALMMISNSRPEMRGVAEALLAPMNFGFFYDPYDAENPGTHPGLLRGGYYPRDRKFTQFHYGMLNTEPRIASYIGIARGDLPLEHYYRLKRADTVASAPLNTYEGVPVPEGARTYRGGSFVPSWDGTMFEALMVPLLVPESVWAPQSWGRNHTAYAQAQMAYGLDDAKLGFWGISASSDPRGGYEPYGVPALASTSKRKPATSVMTPHAAFLTLAVMPEHSMVNLSALESAFPIYGEFGFLDAVDVKSGAVSQQVLMLDQGMILASITNALAGNVLQKMFTEGRFEAIIRPLIAQERFALGDLPIAFAPGIRETTRREEMTPQMDHVPLLLSPALRSGAQGDRRRPKKRRVFS